MDMEARKYFKESAEEILRARGSVARALNSEAKAPRRIILWVIAFQVIELGMVGWLFYKSIYGG